MLYLQLEAGTPCVVTHSVVFFGLGVVGLHVVGRVDGQVVHLISHLGGILVLLAHRPVQPLTVLLLVTTLLGTHREVGGHDLPVQDELHCDTNTLAAEVGV